MKATVAIWEYTVPIGVSIIIVVTEIVCWTRAKRVYQREDFQVVKGKVAVKQKSNVVASKKTQGTALKGRVV